MFPSDHNVDPMRPWTMSDDEICDKLEQSDSGYLDSSSAWRQFQQFFTSRGYDLCFDTLTDAKRPLVGLFKRSDDSFKPSLDEPFPFVYHNPKGFDTFFGGYWKHWRLSAPKVSYAYDKYNRLVVIKVMSKNNPTKELEILKYLNSEALRSSPRNRTIPLLSEISSGDPNWLFFIMPAWQMVWEKETIVFQVDDYFNLVVQSLEGLSFMHENGIAHGDVSRNNIVFNQDGTVHFGTPEVKPLLTAWNCQLAFIDFECAVKYDLSTDPKNWMTTASKGTYPYISPEKIDAYTSGAEYQALPADVYAIASVWLTTVEYEVKVIARHRASTSDSVVKFRLDLYAREILEKYVLQFAQALANMMDEDPHKRPTARKALEVFKQMRESVPEHIRFRPKDGYPAELVSDEEKIQLNGFPWRPLTLESEG